MNDSIILSENQVKLLELVSPALSEQGLELVSVEIAMNPPRTLRLFIERKESKDLVSLDDCVKATHLLDPILEQSPLVTRIMGGAYQLEISSPGVNRPLRLLRDFDRFKGSRAKIQLLRPLSAQEGEPISYFEKHPLQKKFSGVLKGISEQKKVLIQVESDPGLKIAIPIQLISKASLDPSLDQLFQRRNKS